MRTQKNNIGTGKASPRHKESKLQRSCVLWFRLQYPEYTLFAIPNGGYRNAAEAGILKAEGTLAGVADLFLMYPNKGYAGLFIEMKYGAGKQSPAQIAFQEKAQDKGYKYVVSDSLERFILEINSYIR
ncbi:MAG: VRR-NUC domain-containing protein [Prevotella sp.]|jgi:hypothetical protein|nr:VRR-NUC domain-containing protein [Prevotella sp.]